MAKGATKTSSGRRRGISYARFGYYFIIPFFLVYAIFSFTPLLSTFWYSTTNIGETTAEFNGFSNTVVYYDQYLDLTPLYTKNFEKDVGISDKDYSRMKAYFSLQNIIRDQDPFNEEGMQALASLTDLSADTQKSIQAYLSSKNPSDLTKDALKELADYRSNFSALDKQIMDQLPGVITATTAITSATPTEEETSADAVTPEDAIIEKIPDLINELKTLKTTDATDDNKLAFETVDYYATKLNGGTAPKDSFDFLVNYYQGFADKTTTIKDNDFYTTTVGLVAGKAVTTNFTSSLKDILAASDWVALINSLPSIASLQDYADAAKDLHSEQLYTDIKTLSDAGIIAGEKLIEKDGKLVVDEENSLVPQIRKLIDTNYTSDPTQIKAVAHIRNLLAYTDDKTFKAVLDNVKAVKAAGGINGFMNFSGSREVDTSMYLKYKEAIGLQDKMSLSHYEDLDEARKAQNVKDAEAALKENQKALPAAQAEYDKALATGDETTIRTAKEALAKVQTAIRTAELTIKTPGGILTSADAKTSFIFVGLQNYISIFANTTRFTKVFGTILTTVIMWIMNFVPQILLALLLAAWLTDSRLKLKGLSAMKSLIYLPNVMTASTIALFFYRSFQFSTNQASKSLAQQILAIFGDADGFNFFAQPWATRSIVAFINFWMWYGNTMIVLIAGISSISVSLFESAQIDGASSGQIFRRITLPNIRPIILYTLVTALIGGLQMYDIPKLLANGEPTIMFFNTKLKSTETILMYIQDQAFGPKASHQVGVAAAVSVILFILTTIISGILFYVMRDKDAARAKKLAKKGGVA